MATTRISYDIWQVCFYISEAQEEMIPAYDKERLHNQTFSMKLPRQVPISLGCPVTLLGYNWQIATIKWEGKEADSRKPVPVPTLFVSLVN
jgi:hypothetical protein